MIMIQVKIFFSFLLNEHSFDIIKEEVEGEDYSIEYSSSLFVIKLEKYYKEIYVTLYKPDDSINEANLFNLLQFLKRNETDIPTSQYFKKETSIELCLHKQLDYLSKVLSENFSLISEFFNESKYNENMAELIKFWQQKHPEFYH